MSLFDSFVRHLAQQQLFRKEEPLLLAVSGGVDSVVLTDLLHRAGHSFQIAHCNFQLRGEDSELDEQWVQDMGKQYGCPVWVKRFATQSYAEEHGVSIQEAARTLRYSWFAELLEGTPSAGRWLVTAHHADDNAETIVMHFFRGTGLAGIRGMQEKQNRVCRPLLPFSKKDIVAYARQSGLLWREDLSNLSDKYTRNYFRLQVLPVVEKIYPNALHNVLENARRLGEVEDIYQQALEQYRRQLVAHRGAEHHIPVNKLRRCSPLRTVLYELAKPYGFTASQLPDLLHLLDSRTGKFVASASHRIIRNRNWLVIAPLQGAEIAHMVIDHLPQNVQMDGLQLELQVMPAAAVKHLLPGTCEYVNADELDFPLLLRKWKAGDYFYPLGMKKKKKVARFLIDQKMSKTEKERVRVLLSGDRIVCVIGKRIDDRFGVTAHTRQVLRLHQRPFMSR